MLYLMRKIGQSIIVNNTIEVKVVEVKGKSVRLGFSFPPDASVLRKEVYDSIREENIAASQSEGIDDMMSMLQDLKSKDINKK
ncbi:MAG: hypothetical protein K0R63_653 [Rickettsiales bacterium]|jgi:carbon storage regulator|nr:hypothetical protein [Rickettsiales bacterium]